MSTVQNFKDWSVLEVLFLSIAGCCEHTNLSEVFLELVFSFSFVILIRIAFLAFSGKNPDIADAYYSGDCEDAKRECSQSRVSWSLPQILFYFLKKIYIFSAVKFAGL